MKKDIKKHIIRLLLCTVLIGAMLLAGCAQSVTVPDVTGMTQEDAEKAITDAGLTMVIQRERYTDTVPEGSIIEMITKTDDALQKGDEVKVVMSLGEGRTVPSMSVLTVDEASNLLRKVDLNPVIVEEYSDDVPEGGIISYTDGGQIIPKGSDVTLTVSKGPEA